MAFFASLYSLVSSEVLKNASLYERVVCLSGLRGGGRSRCFLPGGPGRWQAARYCSVIIRPYYGAGGPDR